jgi:hypothetical protein
MFHIYLSSEKVARTKSTARPMTSEELAAVGVPPIGETAPPSTNDPVAEAVRDSNSREDGEIRSENKSEGGEGLSNVEVDLSELVVAKATSYPPTFVFGESKVRAEIIKEYEKAEFFPAGDGHPPSGEEVPVPEANKVVVFRDFFTCRLRFLCDSHLPSIFDKFSVKMHQLTLNSFLELSKFFCIMKTFKCTVGADIFARLFELVIEKDILKLDDGKYYEAHYACCTFNTRRKNTHQGLTCIQFAPCSKTNFLKTGARISSM